MANKKRGGRKFRRYLKGNVDELISLGALPARDLAKQDFDEAVNERTFVSSMKALWVMDDFTEGTDIGPIMVGVAHSDYTDAEIEAFIENVGSWDEGDLVNQEIAKRKIRIVGTFAWVDSTASGQVALNEGRKIHTKLGWILNQGQTLSLWGYNLGQAPVATTVPNVHCEGHANLWPQ